MTSYVRQGEIGCCTLLRMLYVLILYVVVGGLQATIAFVVILLEAGGSEGNQIAMSGGEGQGLAAAVRSVAPEVLGWAIGTACLVLLLFLAMGVRMFHRRTFRSVWAGSRVRWHRWWRSMIGAVGGLIVVGVLGSMVGTRNVASTPFLIFALVGVGAQAVNVESFRGYMMQSLVSRGGHWKVKGLAMAPALVAVAFLLPGFMLFYVFVDASVGPVSLAFVVLYLTGCVVLPGVLILLDNGLERAVGVQVAVRGGALLFVCLGVPGLTSWAWGASALIAGVGGVVLWRQRLRTPVRLWVRLRGVLVRSQRRIPTAEMESEGACRNCGTPLVGPYCHQCGQQYRTAKPSITMVAARIVDSVFEVDSRILRTIRLLFLRPGALSAHYFAGRRADFIPPIRLYLVASVVFFLPFAALVPTITGDETDPQALVQVPESVVNRLADETLTPEEVVRQARYTGSTAIDSLPEDTTGERGEEAKEIMEDRFPDAVDERVEVVELGADSVVVLAVSGLPDVLYDAVADEETVNVTVQVRRSTLDSLTAQTLTPNDVVKRGLFFGEAATDSLPEEPSSSVVVGYREGGRVGDLDDRFPSAVRQRIEIEDERADSLVVLTVRDIPEDAYRAAVPPGVWEKYLSEKQDEQTALETVLRNLGQVMFLLMPIFALILSMVYLNEPYAHHLIFSLHVHSFAFLIIGVQLFFELVGAPTAMLVTGRFVVSISVFVYLIGAMRRAYGSTRLRTIGIVCLIIIIYMIIAGIVFGSTVGFLQEASTQLPDGVL